MKKLLLIALCLFSLQALMAQHPIDKANYAQAAKFSPDRLKKMVFSLGVNPHWLKESDRFWYEYKTTEGVFYYLVDPARRSKTPLFDPVKMAADVSRLTGDPFDAQHLPIEKLTFINRETAIRFEVKSQLVEQEADTENQENEQDQQRTRKPAKMEPKVFYFEYNLTTKVLRLLEDYEKPKKNPEWAAIAPDSSYVLFGRNHNLYWMSFGDFVKARDNEKDSTIVENQWTTDGVKHFGYERYSRGDTNVDELKNKDKRKPVSVIWSPNSQRFALIKTDYREVKDLWVINAVAQPRPTLETYKYHMPGEKEAPQSHLMVFDFPSKGMTTVQTEAFKDQTISVYRAPRPLNTRDDDFQPALWLSPDADKVYFERTSRDLKRIDVCVADANTGTVQVLIGERLNTYAETRPLVLLKGGKELIHWSERDGWAHWYRYDASGKMLNQITSGPYHCESFEGVDEATGTLFFTANGREQGEDPYYTHLYKVNLDGTGLTLLNKGNFNHDAQVNDNQRFFVNNYSRVNTAPRSYVADRNGQMLVDLETADLSSLMAAGFQFPEPFKVKADDGVTDLYGVMYKPFDFDSTRQYPIIAYVYPGPQTESVNKAFSVNMDRTDRLAQLGFVVITIGNRGGHPSRSKWYHNYGYGNLRDYGLADKKTAIEQLADRHDFINIAKVGIFGHSGGGFMSTAAMLVYPDFFKVAVSSAGNHENNIYNRWWSEKHHGVKEMTDDKGAVYFKYDIDKNSSLAKNLKGRLFLCTGDIDNNVHPANTIRMADALIKANKRFDFFLYPGQRHGFGPMNEYFFWQRADYFAQHLIGDYSDSVDMVEMNNDKEQNK